ncbi:MAG: hypothetical protein QXK73_05405 [Candidatus Bathyarchaeia archaeon]
MNMNKGAMTSQLLGDFFRAILSKRFNEAEKILYEIEGEAKGENDEFRRGFIQGLKGILYMQRSNEQHTFLSTLDLNNIDLLREHYREFLENSRKKLRSDYDRGYFSALAEHIRFCLKTLSPKKNIQEESV